MAGNTMQANFYDGAILGEREEQQDDRSNLILADGYRLYVLADGMGGQRAGRLASHTICTALRRFMQAHPIEGDLQVLLEQAVQAANKALTEILREQPELDQMGSTLIAVLMNEADNRFVFASVGDSPLYCLRGGQLVRLNANHSYYAELLAEVAAGRISQAEADEHPDRHAITSALNGKQIEAIDVQTDQLAAGELLLLASDGIQTLDDGPSGEIAAILGDKGKDLQQAVEGLLKAVAAKADPYQDNTTLILVRQAQAAPDRVVVATTRPIEPPQLRSRAATTFTLGLLAVPVILAVVAWWYLFGPQDRTGPGGGETQATSPAVVKAVEPLPQTAEGAATENTPADGAVVAADATAAAGDDQAAEDNTAGGDPAPSALPQETPQ